MLTEMKQFWEIATSQKPIVQRDRIVAFPPYVCFRYLNVFIFSFLSFGFLIFMLRFSSKNFSTVTTINFVHNFL